jgi:hypothetical protein
VRILHISHGGLPDPRVERNAEVLAKHGHDMFFLGGHSSGDYKGPFHVVMQAFYGTELLMMVAILKWRKQIRYINPDIIHAHDILAARMTFGMGIPVVYDDHEWWTRNFPIWFNMRKNIRKLFSIPTLLQVPRWEKRAAREYPILTVSEPVAASHRREYDAWVCVTLNYPSLKEVEGIHDDPVERTGAVYVGTDVRMRVGAKAWAPYRDPTGLPDSVHLDRIAGLEYHDLMRRLRHYEVGLIPWSCHPLHHYACPAKAYDYLHSGLQVISPRSMSILSGHPYVTMFDSLEEIPGIIEALDPIDPEEIIEYARRHHVFERYSGVIKDAYVEAFERAWSK